MTEGQLVTKDRLVSDMFKIAVKQSPSGPIIKPSVIIPQGGDKKDQGDGGQGQRVQLNVFKKLAARENFIQQLKNIVRDLKA
jgi:hypothetical protein